MFAALMTIGMTRKLMSLQIADKNCQNSLFFINKNQYTDVFQQSERNIGYLMSRLKYRKLAHY